MCVTVSLPQTKYMLLKPLLGYLQVARELFMRLELNSLPSQIIQLGNEAKEPARGETLHPGVQGSQGEHMSSCTLSTASPGKGRGALATQRDGPGATGKQMSWEQ